MFINSFRLPILLMGGLIGILAGALILFIEQPAIWLSVLISLLALMLAYGQSKRIKVFLYPALELNTPQTQIHPEQVVTAKVQALLDELHMQSTKPPRRLKIGNKLAKLGDPRIGVGINDKGLPEIDWVKIPAGEFLYGEDNQKQSLDTFYISRYSITYIQYQAFIDSDGYTSAQYWKGLEHPKATAARWTQANRPREMVDWFESIAFCRWLSDKGNISVTLPTEQQWEKAARGKQGQKYPWGERYLSAYANVNDQRQDKAGFDLEQTCAVGLYPQGESAYKVMDMAGNVWEWCLNEVENPNNTQIEGKVGRRVLRGSSWVDSPEFARSAFRSEYTSVNRDYSVGFRVVCSLPFSEH